MACIFCQIISGEIKAHVIAETDVAIAILDAFPIARGHTLVLPKEHKERIEDMDGPKCEATFELAGQVTRKIGRIHGDTLVAVHNGPEAGQEIPHLHIHIIPRKRGDGAGAVHSMFASSPAKASDADLAAELEAIKSA